MSMQVWGASVPFKLPNGGKITPQKKVAAFMLRSSICFSVLISLLNFTAGTSKIYQHGCFNVTRSLLPVVVKAGRTWKSAKCFGIIFQWEWALLSLPPQLLTPVMSMSKTFYLHSSPFLSASYSLRERLQSWAHSAARCCWSRRQLPSLPSLSSFCTPAFMSAQAAQASSAERKLLRKKVYDLIQL